jgi:hypothetical protein
MEESLVQSMLIVTVRFSWPLEASAEPSVSTLEAHWNFAGGAGALNDTSPYPSAELVISNGEPEDCDAGSRMITGSAMSGSR